MANITLSVNENTFQIDETNSIIQVNSTPTTVTVVEGGGLDLNEVRQSISAVSPLVYNNTTGVMSFSSTDPLTVGSSLNIGPIANSSTKSIQAYGTGTISGDIRYVPVNGNEKGTQGRWYFRNDIGNTASPGYALPTSTTDLTEGANLYYSTARANAAIGAYKGDINTSGNVTTNILTANVLVASSSELGNINAAKLFVNNAGPTSYQIGLFQSLPGNVAGNISSFQASNLGYIHTSQTLLAPNANIDGNLSIGRGSVAHTPFQFTVPNLAITFANIVMTGGNILSADGANIMSTSVIAEGTRLFYTVARANTAIDARVPQIVQTTTFGQFTANNIFSNQVSTNVITSSTSNVAIASGKTLVMSDNNATITSNLTAGTTQRLNIRSDSVDVYVGHNYPSDVGDNFRIISGTSGNVLFRVGADNTPEYSGGDDEASFLGNVHIGTEGTGIDSGNVILRKSGDISATGTVSAATMSTTGNLNVGGNINATGNINVQNVEDLYVRDQKIVLNANAITNATVEIIANRPSGTSTMLRWSEPNTRWEFTNNGSTYLPIPTNTTDLAEGSNLYYTTDRANTWLAGKTTTDLTEGANLYYTTDRANTAIAAYQGSINTAGNVTGQSATFGRINIPQSDTSNLGIIVNNTRTSGATNPIFTITGAASGLGTDSDWGLQLKSGGNAGEGNGINPDFELLTTAASAGAKLKLSGLKLQLSGGSAANNTIYAQGNITTETGFVGNSLSAITGANAVINTQDTLSLFTRHGLANTSTLSANIFGEGYAVFSPVGSPLAEQIQVLSYAGSTPMRAWRIAGSTTSGSNAISVSSIIDWRGVTGSVSDVRVFQGWAEGAYSFNSLTFPPGTYVTGVDAGTNTIFMSRPARQSSTLSAGTNPFNANNMLGSTAIDLRTGLMLMMTSDYDDFGGSQTVTETTWLITPSLYFYPATGPTVSEFTYSSGTSTDYSIVGGSLTRFMFGRTTYGADNRTILNAPRGITVGTADMTNRAENDASSTGFGINVLYDGTANVLNDYGQSGPNAGIFPQILLKSYTDGTAQGGSAARNADSGPRLFFANGFGNRNAGPLFGYARTNFELGRIAFWTSTSATPAPSSIAPPAYISSVSNREQTFGNSAEVGMYLVASPHDTNAHRLQWAAHHRANTIISSGFNSAGQGPILFTPGTQTLTPGGNSIVHATSTIGGYHFATINYDNATGRTGTRLSVTNGLNTTGARNGNLVLAIDRNNNGAGFGDKEWAFNLAAGSNNLVLAEDGVARTTFEAGGNVTVTGNINLTGRLLGYDRVFGEFFSNVSQTANAANTPTAITLNNTGIGSDVSIVDNSNITIAKPGNYNLQFSLQLTNADNSNEHDFDVWLRKNGTNVPNTNTQYTVVRGRSGANGKNVAALNLFLDAAAGDVYQIMFAVTDTQVSVEAIAELTTPYARPATPSAIVTVAPVGA